MAHPQLRLSADARPRHGTLVGPGLTVVLALAACSPSAASPGAGGASVPPTASADGSTPGTSAPAASAPSASASSDVAGGGSASGADPCSLAETAEIAALVGADVTGTAAEQAQGGVCTYVPVDGGLGFATVTVFNAQGPDLERAISDFSLGDLSSPVGDAAAGIDGTIFVQTGDTLFSIVATNGNLQPVPLAELERLAATIVERLGGTNATPSASPEASPSPSG